jgi:hypothetical protein
VQPDGSGEALLVSSSPHTTSCGISHATTAVASPYSLLSDDSFPPCTPLAAAIVSSSAPAPSSLPGCPSKCGDIDIPLPFGIRAECAWQGEGGGLPYIGNIEIKNISVETGEMYVYTPVAYRYGVSTRPPPSIPTELQ